MSKEGADKKTIFKQIFKDGWDEFKAHHPRYEGVDEAVQKMPGCEEFENGYSVYIYPECLGEKNWNWGMQLNRWRTKTTQSRFFNSLLFDLPIPLSMSDPKPRRDGGLALPKPTRNSDLFHKAKVVSVSPFGLYLPNLGTLRDINWPLNHLALSHTRCSIRDLGVFVFQSLAVPLDLVIKTIGSA